MAANFAKLPDGRTVRLDLPAVAFPNDRKEGEPWSTVAA